MKKKQTANIAVLVSGGGTNLQALINAQNKGILTSGRIVLVISNNANAFALTRAQRAGIDTAVITRKEAGSQEAMEQKICETLDAYKIDLIILAGFMSILSADFTGRLLSVSLTFQETVTYGSSKPRGSRMPLIFSAYISIIDS